MDRGSVTWHMFNWQSIICSLFLSSVFLFNSIYNWEHTYLSDLLYLLQCSWASSRLSQMAVFLFHGWIIFLPLQMCVHVCVCIHIIFSIFFNHRLIDTLGCFHVFAVVGNAAVNMGVQTTFGGNDFVSFWYSLRSRRSYQGNS